MAVHDLFEVTREILIESGRRAVLSGKTERFRKQPDARFGRMNDGNRLRVVLDDNFRTRADARHQRREVARRFRVRDVDHVLNHNSIIHDYPNSSTKGATVSLSGERFTKNSEKKKRKQNSRDHCARIAPPDH